VLIGIGGALAFVLLVVLAVGLSGGRKPQAEVAVPFGPVKPVAPKAKGTAPKEEVPPVPLPVEPDEDDSAAARALSASAYMQVRFPNRSTMGVRRGTAPPPGPFAIVYLDFHDDGRGAGFADALVPYLANLRSLEHVRMAGGVIPVSASNLRALANGKCADRLESLQTGCPLTDEALDELKRFPRLHTVRFRAGSADDAVLERLAELRALKCLELGPFDRPRATRKGWAAVAALKLGYVWIDRADTDTAMIFEELTRSGGPKEVAMVNCKLTDEHLAALAARPTDVRTLHLSGCRDVTDKGLEHLATVASLEKVIHFYTGFTDSGLQKFQMARPKVRVERGLTAADIKQNQ